MADIYVYVREQLYKAYGVRVIVDKVISLFDNAQVVHSLDRLDSKATVIPYGVLEAYKLIKAKRFKLTMALLVDAFSLGQIEDVKEFGPYSYIPLSYKVKCFLRYFRHLYCEHLILKNYNKVMLVSWGDRDYYAKIPFTKKYVHKIVVVHNGVNMPVRPAYQYEGNKPFRIGCLSAWTGTQVVYTLKIFMEEVWCKLPQDANIELVIAGRGLSEDFIRYLKKFKGVRIIGEVADLKDFYDNVDATLVTMLKKCGIINRVLDGFAYKVPLVCPPANLLAFKDLPDCCYTYSNTKSFMDAINAIRNNPKVASKKSELAYEYIKQHCDWDNNYRFIKDLITEQCK